MVHLAVGAAFHQQDQWVLSPCRRVPPSPPCRIDLLECVLTTISAHKLVPVVFADALAMLAELLDWHRPEMTGRKLFGSSADRWRRP